MRDQGFDQIRIGAVLGDARHVVEELVLCIGAEIGRLDLGFGQIGHKFEDILDAVIDDAHGAGCERRIAAGLVDRRGFQHNHGSALFVRGEGRTKRGIAAAHNDNVPILVAHFFPAPF